MRDRRAKARPKMGHYHVGVHRWNGKGGAAGDAVKSRQVYNPMGTHPRSANCHIGISNGENLHLCERGGDQSRPPNRIDLCGCTYLCEIFFSFFPPPLS
ncbi:conserved Plasmodium protein, unknown function [Plasmodium vivax]|uniref:Uncharacterized protein n=3 Tax=Plasmodium vivax TaxID=5855 RepID=A5KCC6_PLAVS|nr:hypothetical protein PVX_001782 [Plasmodium vivax]EDL42990.1 hypothetical protein PVX_001782 [Plasmodium vivax]KMZ87746.1 hypothetical protein PVBG_03847 [Plasmodium vivax Brazil I]KMZ94271.1 hypothetical protein PVMG_02497 [Plasmodium vivax Mauritania I]CAI7719136.1 conserved Plasmodium protein, unknown function [Plasmodium vivax]|eukprot:XP_001612717.1 hypothetical protein [Plasmodium vivax Sal-1]